MFHSSWVETICCRPEPGRYRAVIRSTLAPGHLTLGHYVLPSTERHIPNRITACNAWPGPQSCTVSTDRCVQ